MNSPTTSFAMSSHQAIMKCPWQWRQPFLDEKRASRKRKVGDGYFYDPVDPSFVDHLLPGHAKKFCANVLETDEKEKIELEIQRLMLEKEERAARLIYDALVFGNATANSERASSSSSNNNSTSSSRSAEDNASASNDTDASAVDSSASVENMALVDSILLMTKSVDGSSLLASPKSVSSPLSPLLDDSDDEQCLSLNSSISSNNNSTTTTTLTCLDTESDADFDEPLYARASSLELVSDNLQDNYFASEDSDLLDFPAAE